jgi:uncharacterized repeat protein (TIGR01451 family)
MQPKYALRAKSVIMVLAVLTSVFIRAQENVLRPGDSILASSANSPVSEGVANAIDGQTTKYLNSDTDADGPGGSKPSGFVVTPSIGPTTITGITMQSANDSPDRDPRVVMIEGSNDDRIIAFTSGNWELIARIGNVPAWTDLFGNDNRFKTQTLLFNNSKAYRSYRWSVLGTQGPSTCCSQIAEVGFLRSDPTKVQITEPANGAFFLEGTDISIEATASSSNGRVAKMEFFRGATKLGEILNSPYRIVWTNAVRGNYSLTARATDDQGGTRTSVPLAITIIQALDPSDGSPIGGQLFSTGEGIEVKVLAAEAGSTSHLCLLYPGPIRYLTSNRDEGKTISLGTFPYGVELVFGIYVPDIAGSPTNYVFLTGPGTRNRDGIPHAKVEFVAVHHAIVGFEDIFGGGDRDYNDCVFDFTGGISPIRPTATNRPPVVNITSPANGATFTAGANITITANASDPDGQVTLLGLYTNDVRIATSTNAPYSTILSNMAVGSYTLTAKARDNDGLISTSAPVNITVMQKDCLDQTAPSGVNLSTWTVHQYEFGLQPNASWELSPRNTIVTQTVNSDASIFLSDFDAHNNRIEGMWRMLDSTDDDFVGFVFGFQDRQHFYLFDWKGANQNDPDFGFAERGMSVKVINSSRPLNGKDDLWPSIPEPSRVRTLFHNTIPWKINTDYRFTLDFVPGHISITIREGQTELASIKLDDFTFTSGKFGFYNNSQAPVRYTGFTRKPIWLPPSVLITSPAPASEFIGPTNVTIRADASACGTSIDRVEFFRDGIAVGQSAVSPYNMVWPSVPPGVYSLTARAVDGRGVFSVSTPVTITVKPLTGCASFCNGLIAWWPGEGNANDIAGLHNGTLQTGVSFSPGLVGQALSFDGKDGHVKLSASALTNRFSQLTMEGWVFPLRHGKNSAGSGLTILSKTEIDGFALRVSDGFLQADLRLSAGDKGQTFSQKQLALNAWSHVAVIYDGASVSGYLNGQQLGSSAASGIIRNVVNGGVPLMIGNEPTLPEGRVQASGFGWQGRIDEVAVFDRALSQFEIQAIYAAGAAGKCSLESPLIQGQPQDQTVRIGATATFQVETRNATGFQWRFNRAPVLGATNPTFILQNVQSMDGGEYDVLVSNCGSSTNSATAKLTVLSDTPSIVTNTVPALAAIPNQTTREDTPTPAIAFTVRDTETPSTNLVVTAASSTPSLVSQAGIMLEGNGTNRTITLTPSRDQFGVSTVNVIVRDAEGLTVINRFYLTVTPVNDPPTLDLIGNVTVDEDSSPSTVKLTGIGTGASNEVQALRVTAISSTPSLIPSPTIEYASPNAEGTLRFTPAPNAYGTNTVTVTIDDGGPENATTSRTFLVIVRPVNDLPVFSAIAPQRIDETKPLILTIVATDPDLPAQTLIYSLAADAPLGSGINSTGQFIWTPTEAQGPSTNVIALRVTDNGTPSLSATTNFTVIVNEVNLPPVLVPLPDQTIQAGETMTVRSTATDPDFPANVLSFSLDTVAPAGASIDSNTGVFTWTPGTAQAPSTNRFTVRVTDNGLPPLSDSKTFTVFVQPKPTTPGNMPPTVSIKSPADRTIFQDGEPIRIEATANDPDPGGRVVRVEFFAGSRKLGEVSAQPNNNYTFLWVGANEGQYDLMARAVDDQGATGDSAPVRIVVSKACTQAAIVGNFDDSEITNLLEYLYEIGVKASVFSREEAMQEATIAAQLKKFENFGLVIWDDVGRTNLSEREVNFFGALANPELGKALYYIGDTLVSSAQQLSPLQQTQWFELIHLKAKSGVGVPTRVMLDTALGDPVVGPRGKVGTVQDFNYPFPDQGVEQTRSPIELVWGQAGNSDVLVAFEEPTTGASGRRITQAFHVTNGGDDASKAERKKLFQNAVWWLMKCVCDNLDVTIVDDGSPTAAKVGEQLTYSVKVTQGGGCEALFVAASSVLPPGLEFIATSSNFGVSGHNNGVVSFALGRLIRGAEATLQIRARVLQGGVFTNEWQLRSLNESDGARDDNHLEIITQVEGPVESPVTLSIKAGAGDLIEITLRGTPDQTVVVETSADLRTWTPLRTVVLAGGQAVFSEVNSAISQPRFYRATRR